jgi:hypothetical protein
VYLEDPPKDDVQQSFFLAETLKVRNLINNNEVYNPLAVPMK